MNMFVLVPLVLVFLLFLTRYLYRREPGFILVPRIGLASICLGFPLYFVFTRPEIFSSLAAYAEWITVFAFGAALLLYNSFFSGTVRRISDGIEKQEQEKKLPQVEARAAELAKKIVANRDGAEFERLREEALERRVVSEFDQKLHLAIGAEVYMKEQQRLRKRTEGDDPLQAIWVGLHGADKALGCELDGTREMLAVPYWIKFQLDQPPQATRFNRSQAEVKNLYEIAFVAKRWSKVEDQVAVVVDGAVVYPPAPR